LKRYETIFILRPDTGEAQIKETSKRLEGIVAQGGGELIETEEWGQRELAYRIRGERRGHYVRLDYVAPPAAMNEIERNLKLSDAVLRYLSVLIDPDADAAKARAEIEARNRRAAEARAAAEARTAAAAAAAAAQAEKHDESAEGSAAETERTSEPDSGRQSD
jgi:small subunit ribosomal protein S6